LRYIDFTASESAQAEVSSDQKGQPSSGYTEHTQKNPKKHSSSFAFWSEDRHDLTSVLARKAEGSYAAMLKGFIPSPYPQRGPHLPQNA